MNSLRPHLPEDELHAWLDGQLSPAQRVEIAEHLLGCLICRAAEAEARSLRTRVSELLAVAAPTRRQPVPVGRDVRRHGGQVMKVGTAAAILLMVGGTVSSIVLDRLTASPGAARPSVGIASVFVAPAVIARVGSGLVGVATAEAVMVDAVAAVPSGRQPDGLGTALASRTALSPRVVGGNVSTTALRRPAAPVDPLTTAVLPDGSWQAVSMAGARENSGGSVAHLSNVPVSIVRLRESEQGARPLSMVRQVLADGRAVWVIEGVVEEMNDVYQMLTASGLNLSTPRRGLPDYVGPAEAPTRTVRMVTVAAYLPSDSLEVLAAQQLTVR